MTCVVFRVDSSDILGTGHLMRCIALAQELRRYHIKSIFITKRYCSRSVTIIKEFNFLSHSLSLNHNFIQDSQFTLNVAKKNHARYIITDLSNPDVLADLTSFTSYLNALKKNKQFLIVFDGFGKECISTQINLPVDIIIIPYYSAEKKKYKTSSKIKLLLGADYSIFRQEFIEAAKKNRIIKKEANKILIALSGGENTQLIIQVIHILSQIKNLQVKITPGLMQNRHTSLELKKRIASFLGKFDLDLNNNLAQLMLWADLAIIGSGLIKYEAALLGLPSIVISQIAVQKEIIDEFEKQGSILHLSRPIVNNQSQPVTPI